MLQLGCLWAFAQEEAMEKSDDPWFENGYLSMIQRRLDSKKRLTNNEIRLMSFVMSQIVKHKIKIEEDKKKADELLENKILPRFRPAN
jgi:hypothetical protein